MQVTRVEVKVVSPRETLSQDPGDAAAPLLRIDLKTAVKQRSL